MSSQIGLILTKCRQTETKLLIFLKVRFQCEYNNFYKIV